MYSKNEIALMMKFAREQYTKEYFTKFEKFSSLEQRRRISNTYCHRDNDVYLPIFNLLKRDSDIAVRINIAKQKCTSVDILSHLANDEEFRVREAVAQNIQTPSHILLLLSHSPENAIKLAVAKHRNVSSLTLEKLAEGKIDNGLATKLAKNMKTPFKALRKLATLEYEPIKVRLCRNLITPSDILFDIAKSDSNTIKNRLAKRCWLPEEILKKYSFDSNRYIRSSVARNKSLTKEIAETLSNDPCEYVRASVASSGLTSELTLEKLIYDKSSQVRKAIAMHTPSQRLQLKLLHDDSGYVRSGLAYNRHASTDIMRGLLKDPDERVRYSATCNIHKIPEDQWDDLIEIAVAQENAELISRIENYKNNRSKQAAISKLYDLLGGRVALQSIIDSFPRISPDWFPLIYADGEAENIILRELCLNPSTPKEILELYFKTYPENKDNVWRDMLAYDSSYNVNGKTTKALHAMALYCTGDNLIRNLSNNKNCTSKSLSIIVGKGNVATRANVASHDATSIVTLEKLAKDPEIRVKFNIIRRNIIPESVRRILNDDPFMAEVLEERLAGAYFIPGYNMGYYFNRREARRVGSR